jgi:hypothetical protein
MIKSGFNKLTVLFVLFCFWGLQAIAQTTVQIGLKSDVSPTTLYSPIYRVSATSTVTAARSNIVFTANELAAVGITNGSTILSLQFNKTNVANFVTPATFRVFAANTSNASLATTLTWASIQNTHTQVFSSTNFNVPSAAGWVTIVFSTPFVYTGGSLEIATDLAMVGNGGATDNFAWQYTDTIPVTKIVGVASAGTTLNGAVAGYKFRPNTRITFVPSTPCTTPPTAGTSLVSRSLVCSGSSVLLDLSGVSAGSGQTYEWERSTTIGGTYTSVGAATISPLREINPTASYYYRCAVTCGANTTYSTPVLVQVNPGLSGVFTINASLPASANNFQTINNAVAALGCGITGPVTFLVDSVSGPYNEQVVIPQIAGASATNTIRFIGNNAIVQATTVTANRHIFRLDGADFVTLKGFNIKTLATDFAWGVHLTNDARFDSIIDCNIDMSSATATTTQSYNACIVSSGSTTTVTTTGNNANFCYIGNNKLKGGYQGIILAGISTSLNTSNTITNNIIEDFYGNGIEITNQNRANISFNDISRANRTATTTFAGIELGTGNQNVTINANKIHDTHNSATTQSGAAYGIYSTTCDAPVDSENVVTNNLIYNFNSLTGTQYGLYNSNSDGVKYLHNTVVLNDTFSTAGIVRGFYQTTLATNITLRNNIISVSRRGTGLKHCVYFGAATSTISSDNNVLVTTNNPAIYSIGYYSTSFTTLNDWKNANGGIYDQQSISLSPGFVGPYVGNFVPTNGFVNNTGVPVGVSSDINGSARSLTNPDPGAYEFSLGPCATPPTAGNSTSNPSLPVCNGDMVELSLDGNSFGTSQTYQWEQSANIGGPYTAMGTPNILPIFNTAVTASTYYRCAITCSGITSYSTPVFVQVNPPLAGGTYTINSSLPTGSGNFQTFEEAAGAVNCGITGSVIFNVASGTYTTQFRLFPKIIGTDSVVFQSAVQDSAMVIIQQPSSASASSNYIVNIEKTRNIKFNNLTFIRTGSSTNSTIIRMDSTQNISFNAVHFYGPTYTAANSTGTQSAIFSDDVNTEDSTIVVNSKFSLNSNGLWFFSNENLPSNYIKIENNIFNVSYASVFLKHHNNGIINNNNISRGATFAADFFGLSLENNKSARVFNNTISFDRGYGIRLIGSSGTAQNKFNIYNNMINGSVAATSLVYGISIESNASYNVNHLNILHNTVVVNNTSATTGRTINMSGTSTSTNENVLIQNNILLNSGSGYVYSVPSNAAASTVKFNFNSIATNGTNIGTWGSTTGIVNEMKTWIRATGQDSFSTRYAPNFVSANNLRIAASSLGNFALACTPISSVLFDIDGLPRNSTYVYKGASEGATALTTTSGDGGIWDILSPNPVSTNGNQDLTVRLRNNGIVNLTSADIYHSINGVAGSFIQFNGNLAPGKDTILTIATVNMPIGNNVLKAWTENINFSATDIDRTNDTTTVIIQSNTPLNGTYTVGVGGNFNNLTEVSAALLNRVISGNVVFELLNTYTSSNETFPITFTYPGRVLPYAVTIHPASGVTGIETSGDPGSGNALITLDGISGLTFDGRAGATGTTLDWKIRNRRTAATYGSVIRLANGSQRNVFNYLTLESQSTGTTTGLFHISTSTVAGFGNSYNTLSNSLLQDRTDTTRTTPAVGVYSAGTAANPNDSNVIINNTITNFTNTGISVTATGNGGNWNISNNQFYYNSQQTPTATAAQTAINFIAESNSNRITNNTIGGSALNATGAAWTNSGSNLFAGIIVGFDTLVPSMVSGNVIKNITKTATGGASFAGIRANQGRFVISNNTIGDLTASNSIINSGSSTTFGIEVTNATGTADTAFIQNNIVANITTTGVGVGARLRGIAVNFNEDASVLHYITGNTVTNLKCASATLVMNIDLIAVVGIVSFNQSYRPGCVIANNNISNISATTTGATQTISAGLASSNYAGLIYNNTILNVNNSATNPGPLRASAVGMYNRFHSNSLVYNNMIALGEGNADSAQINGILISGTGGGTHNYAHNTVVINPSTSNNVSSFAFHRGDINPMAASAHPINLRNNIFINKIVSAGNHYAIGLEDVSGFATGASNYNMLYSVDTTKIALFGSVSHNITTWQTASLNDAQSKSKDVQFVSPTAGDLHLAGTSVGDFDLAGTPIALVAVDYDLQTRNTTAPYMGADENVGSPLPVELMWFSGKVNGKNAQLSWATASEVNTNYFVVEYAIDGKNFSTANTVKANGNSAVKVEYNNQHLNAFDIANTLYYRLKIVDLNGDVSYSKTIKLSIAELTNASATAYPNPFINEVVVDVPTIGDTKAKVTITNLQGVELMRQETQFENGKTKLVGLDGLSSGIYLITVESNEFKQTLKIVK